ncbi:MFS transporter [Kiloniella laminariae]|uniref:MFS transporter n=1 Tax=Kiloniella laminariae TaxID=454162 RepID=A0ABT4LSH1_9PROT|nr:MFS transporter [Kiloniella laminariae]MCZ4282882.1 MFS transporter [Kiloniella laminariae]
MKKAHSDHSKAITGVKEDRPISSPRLTLAGLSLSMLLSSLGVSIANVALPTLAQIFAASFQEVQWVIIAYLLAITITIVTAGRIADLFGHKRVFLTGIFLFAAASVLCGLAPELWILITARTVQGLGAAIMMALTMVFVRETVSKERMGSAMGLLGTMSAVGTALGPSLGGLILSGPGWQFLFLAMAPLGILSFVLTYFTLPRDRQAGGKEQQGFDSLGTAILGLTLAAYALAVTLGNGQFGRLNLCLFLAAVSGTGFFVLVESKSKSPLIRLSLFRKTALSSSLGLNVIVSTVMMSTLVVGPFYLSRTLALDEALVGLVLSAGPVISAISGIPAGRLVDYYGAPFMIRAGLLTMMAGSLALSLLPSLFGMTGYIIAIAVLTPGYQLFQASNNTVVMGTVEPDQKGVISGMLNLSRNLGLITGASAMGAVFALASASENITSADAQSIATGMQITFATATLLIAIAFLVSIMADHTPWHRRVLPQQDSR